MMLRQAVFMSIFLLAVSSEGDADIGQAVNLRGAVRTDIQTNSTFQLAIPPSRTSHGDDIDVELCKYLCGSGEGAGCADPSTTEGKACWDECWACCAQDSTYGGDLAKCCQDPTFGFRYDGHQCPEDDVDQCSYHCEVAVRCWDNDDVCKTQCRACCTQDANLAGSIGSTLDVCCNNYACEGFSYDGFQCAKDVRIDDTETARVYNEAGREVVMLIGGVDGDYCNHGQYIKLAQEIAKWGYCVVLLRGNDAHSNVIQAGLEFNWAVKLAVAVRDHYANGRPLAVVGHSLGGGGALAVSERVPGLAAYVAMHPLAIIAGLELDKTNGPLLLTTGTADVGFEVQKGVSLATEQEALWAATQLQAPLRAFVDITGNEHATLLSSQEAFGGLEFEMLLEWLACHMRDGDERDSACGKFVDTCKTCKGVEPHKSCDTCQNVYPH